MLSVAEARARILSAFAPLPAEQVALPQALGRVLAEPVHARLTQPPFAVSAMDGYAPAGSAYDDRIKPGEAVRIFTGAPLPQGADTIVIQEDTEASGETVL